MNKPKKPYRLWKGQKIKVFSVSLHRYLGIWEYEKAVHITRRGRRGLYTPLFRQGKKKIHGYACWWIPLSEAKRIEKLQESEARKERP